MKKLHKSLIKAECIKYASENDMKIIVLTDNTFTAEGENCVVDVPLDHLYDQLKQGWNIQDTLQNETNYLQ